MKCSVTFRHMKSSDPLREYVEEKINKVSKFLDTPGESHVVLSVEKRFHVVHIDLITEGAHRIQAVERSEDMYGSIDNAIEKLLRQVKRFKEKDRSHREPTVQRGRELTHQFLRLAKNELDEVIEKPQVVRTQTIVAREMTIDDAVLQMDLLNSDFLVFTDAMTHQISVMYRLPDGQYGLIEARPAA